MPPWRKLLRLRLKGHRPYINMTLFLSGVSLPTTTFASSMKVPGCDFPIGSYPTHTACSSTKPDQRRTGIMSALRRRSW